MQLLLSLHGVLKPILALPRHKNICIKEEATRRNGWSMTYDNSKRPARLC